MTLTRQSDTPGELAVPSVFTAEAEHLPRNLLTRGDELPVFAFTLAPGVDDFTVFDVSNALRERAGWCRPTPFPENRKDLAALRVVVRRGFGHDMADLLMPDLERQLPRLQQQAEPLHEASDTGFHH
jgi:glutamate decarboxylase